MADIRLVTRPVAPGNYTAPGGAFAGVSGTRDGALFEADWLHKLAQDGRIFFASQGTAQNSSYTAAGTSFAATAPDWTLEVPAGTTCIPLSVSMVQTGTVAGGLITVLIGYQNAAERSSAGTALTLVSSSRSDKPLTPQCTVYSLPTVSSDTVGVRLWASTLKADVTNAQATQQVYWTPLSYEVGCTYLVGPAALKGYSFASTTAPTWFADFAWAEIPTAAVS